MLNEDQDLMWGPRLWDATPGVCCAYFQLGACQHTEAFNPEDEYGDPVASYPIPGYPLDAFIAEETDEPF